MLLLLGGVLLVLFVRSIDPSEVVFSNDGPYGGMVAQHNRMPAILTGYWRDLNWIGDQQPAPSPDISTVLRLATSPLGFSKFFCPFALFILGICAWFCFWQWKLSPAACVLGALATAFSSHFFSTACWGVAAQVIGIGMCFVAVGLVNHRSGWKFWVRLVLAGLAVGINIMESYDIGAIFSLFVAAYVLFDSLISESIPVKGFLKGVLQVVIVAGFAAFCAAQAITVLYGTQVKGVTDERTNMTPEQKWDWATQWSMPPRELPRIFISGLFGYRMDTPKDMAALGSWFEGGVYWGEVGGSPMLDRYIEEYHAKGGQGIPPGIPGNAWRFNGGGEYAGVIVVVVAFWAVLQAFRKDEAVFSPVQRKFIWFWAAAALVSLILATGRYAPFYRLFYMLPRVSNIRNASKFMHPFHWSLVILFAFGIHGLVKRYLAPDLTPQKGSKPSAPQKSTLAALPAFDRNFVFGLFIAIGISLLGWLIYATNHDKLATYISQIGFGDPNFASHIASFSIKEVGWFVLFLILSAALLTAIFTGRFSGASARWGSILLGVLLMIDLARADLPWIIYQNWVTKYASNPVLDLLRAKPYEHRVALFPADRFFNLQDKNPQVQTVAQSFGELYNVFQIEWAQHQFQYYNIESISDVQRPREAPDFVAYERGPLAATPFRHWELTNTKYFLVPAPLAPALAAQGFRPLVGFDLRPKPGVTAATAYEDLTAETNSSNPQFMILDYTNSLPRAQLYSTWQVNTNDDAVLRALASTNFNPHASVILDEPASLSPPGSANQSAGSVEITHYAPKTVSLRANAASPCILLLNDKYDSNWHVTVDGKPAQLLRANYIMRAVALSPGEHQITFHFAPSTTSLYVSLAAIALGFALIGVLVVAKDGEVKEKNSTADGRKVRD